MPLSFITVHAEGCIGSLIVLPSVRNYRLCIWFEKVCLISFD